MVEVDGGKDVLVGSRQKVVPATDDQVTSKIPTKATAEVHCEQIVNEAMSNTSRLNY